jgi:hypothetical protein
LAIQQQVPFISQGQISPCSYSISLQTGLIRRNKSIVNPPVVPTTTPPFSVFLLPKKYITLKQKMSHKRDVLESVTEVLEPKKARVDKKSAGT